jgi:hypothetical protein
MFQFIKIWRGLKEEGWNSRLAENALSSEAGLRVVKFVGRFR